MCELAFNTAGERYGMCESSLTVLHVTCQCTEFTIVIKIILQLMLIKDQQMHQLSFNIIFFTSTCFGI
jgi:hypothetical protein